MASFLKRRVGQLELRVFGVGDEVMGETSRVEVE